MYFRLITHLAQQLWRSVAFWKQIGIRFIQVLFSAYVALGLIAGGFVLPIFLEDAFPEQNPLALVNRYLILGVVVLLAVRAVAQKMPGSRMRPYLTMPIQWRTLTRLAQLDAAVSVLNVLPLCFVLPLWGRLFLDRPTMGWTWLGGVLLLIAATHFLHLVVHLWFENAPGRTLAGGGVVALVGGVDALTVGALETASAALGEALAGGSLWAVSACAVAVVGAAVASQGALRRQLRIIAAGETGSRPQKRTGSDVFSALARWMAEGLPRAVLPAGAVPTFVLQARIMARSKRAKHMIYASLLFVAYGAALPILSAPGTVDKASVIYVVIGVAGLGINFGQYAFAWHGQSFDRLLSAPMENTLVVAILRYVQIISLLGTIVLLPAYAVFWPSGIPLLGAVVLYVAGIFAPMTIAMSTLSREALNLNTSSAFSMQGANFSLVLAAIVLFLPVLGVVLLPVTLQTYVLAGAGLLGIVGDAVWRRALLALYDWARFPMAAGFRSTEDG
jgi:hypothetical protein